MNLSETLIGYLATLFAGTLIWMCLIFVPPRDAAENLAVAPCDCDISATEQSQALSPPAPAAVPTPPEPAESN
ncbi:MAG: hypothetical protein GDA55_02120 [Cellvibrionales bacterium]|nr:hypothetical protein [Cellvibrionales bacterium]